jgi:hypothetical protein
MFSDLDVWCMFRGNSEIIRSDSNEVSSFVSFLKKCISQ